MSAEERRDGRFVVFCGLFCLTVVLALTGITTHRSNIERQRHDRDVKIACVQAGDFSAADCNHIVGYDQESD